ncbi:hypothetical protein CCP2SC5_740021 [Azospirillaceae bacterium]
MCLLGTGEIILCIIAQVSVSTGETSEVSPVLTMNDSTVIPRGPRRGIGRVRDTFRREMQRQRFVVHWFAKYRAGAHMEL